MINITRFALSILSLALAVIWSTPVRAQLTKINVGYSAISGDALPAWIAKDAGIFEKNGLDVQLVFFSGGTTAVMALIAADTPIAQLAGPAVVHSAMAGSDATLIVGGVTSLNYYLMGRPEIKTPEQLKGGSVAISRFGSSSDFIARYALSKVGLTPGKDVTIVQIGSTTARVDAALSGRVQATVVQPPASICPSSVWFTSIPAPQPRRDIFASIQTSSGAMSNPRWTPSIESTPIKKLPLKRWPSISAATSIAMS
jgi:ABC-type nitrate/sulfonate/bicarbonate transport system substrate-binding protein